MFLCLMTPADRSGRVCTYVLLNRSDEYRRRWQFQARLYLFVIRADWLLSGGGVSNT